MSCWKLTRVVTKRIILPFRQSQQDTVNDVRRKDLGGKQNATQAEVQKRATHHFSERKATASEIVIITTAAAITCKHRSRASQNERSEQHDENKRICKAYAPLQRAQPVLRLPMHKGDTGSHPCTPQ